MWCRLQKKLHMLGGKKGKRVKGGRQSRDNLRRKLVIVNHIVNHYDYYNIVCGLGRLAGPVEV